MRRPFIFFTIPILLGIVFYYYIDVSIYSILFLLILIIIINLVLLKFKSSIDKSLLISFFLLGMVLAGVRSNSSQLIQFTDIPLELTGIIKDAQILSQEESRYIVEVHNIKDNGIDKNIKEKVSLKIIGSKVLALGDEIRFKGILREPLPNTNPRLYNHKLNLLMDNIFTTVTIKDYSVIDTDQSMPNILYKLKGNFIIKVEETFQYYFTGKSSDLMKSILLGKTSYLDQESIQQIRDLGLAHILAVSGLHIGIITGVLLFLFAYIGLNRKLNIVLTVTILWLYAYIIGNPLSVLRANIMFTLLLLANLWAEPYDSINALFFALFILIIINPYWILDLGFQLSFIATFSILYLTPRLNQIFYSKDSNIMKALVGILSVQIGLFPILSYYFNRIPIMSILANLLFIPIFSICLILSIVLIPISSISISIANSVGIIIDVLLKVQFCGIEVLNHFPLLTIKLPSPSIIVILIYYIFIFILFGIIDIRSFNKRVSKAIVFYCLLLVLVNSIFISLDSTISVNFIDVGQGDCILLKTKEGAYLIDTGGNIFGNFDIGKNILLPYLEKEGIFKLKGVFVTHYDADHCKSLPLLMENLRIDNIYIGYEREDNSLYRDIVEGAYNNNIPIILLKKGDRLRLDRNTILSVLGPDNGLLENPKLDENDLSLVLLLNYYEQKILFTGDIEKVGEENLINSLDTKVQFLKVPHHGSNTSSGVDFLNRIRPDIGFVSVGRNNSFGHPHKEIVDRYMDMNVEFYRTDKLGFINLTMERDNYWITPFLKEKLSIIYIMEYLNLVIIYLIVYFIVSYILVKYFALLEERMEKIEL